MFNLSLPVSRIFPWYMYVPIYVGICCTGSSAVYFICTRFGTTLSCLTDRGSVGVNEYCRRSALYSQGSRIELDVSWVMYLPWLNLAYCAFQVGLLKWWSFVVDGELVDIRRVFEKKITNDDFKRDLERLKDHLWSTRGKHCSVFSQYYLISIIVLVVNGFIFYSSFEPLYTDLSELGRFVPYHVVCVIEIFGVSGSVARRDYICTLDNAYLDNVFIYLSALFWLISSFLYLSNFMLVSVLMVPYARLFSLFFYRMPISFLSLSRFSAHDIFYIYVVSLNVSDAYFDDILKQYFYLTEHIV